MASVMTSRSARLDGRRSSYEPLDDGLLAGGIDASLNRVCASR